MLGLCLGWIPRCPIVTWLQISGPTPGLVLSVSWDFWSIGLVLLLAGPAHSIRHKLARKSSLDRCPGPCASNLPHFFFFFPNLPHFWDPAITFFGPSITISLNQKKAKTCLEEASGWNSIKGSFPIHSLLLALPVENNQNRSFWTCVQNVHFTAIKVPTQN